MEALVSPPLTPRRFHVFKRLKLLKGAGERALVNSGFRRALGADRFGRRLG